MGLPVWLLLTLLVAITAYAAAASLPLQGRLERWMATLMIAAADVLVPLDALGQFDALTGPRLAVAALALNLPALVALGWGGRRGRLLATLRSDLAAPRRLAREVIGGPELSAYALVLALVAVAVSLLIVWRFPSWSWDCVGYHVPIADYVVQEHGNRWLGTNDFYIDGYPRNVELLSVWNTLLIGDTRLDDAAQLPFGLLGALAVAAFCRRLRVPSALAASAGAMWLITPAVCLQLHTTHADIAAGALFVAAVYFLSAPRFGRLARWLLFLTLGLYAGSKVTGLFHLALLSPVLAWRLWVEVRRSPARARFAGELLGQVALLVLLGGFAYLRNTFKFGNPFWPVHVQVPFFGFLPGPIDPHTMAWPPAFFGAPGAFEHMVHQWYTPSNNYYPDVREGPFGVLFAWLTLPAFLLMAALAPFHRERWQWLAVVMLGVLAVLVPVAWWGRYTLGMPAAAIIAFAVLHARVRLRTVQVGLSAAAAFLSVASYAAATQGYRVLPTPVADERTRAQDEIRLRQEIDWLWPYNVARYRDRVLRPGDIIATDGAADFLAEFWTPDLRDRVELVPDDGDDVDYLRRIEQLKPVWISVGAGSRAEQVLRSRPDLFEFMFPVPRSPARMYRVLRWLP